MIRARKRFGQHFLHDPGVLARIVAAIDPKPGECVVEIGPGRGALTFPLLERCKRLEVIERPRPGRCCERAQDRESSSVTRPTSTSPCTAADRRFASAATCATSRRRCSSTCSNRAPPSPTCTHAAEGGRRRIVARPAARPRRLTVMLAAACWQRLFRSDAVFSRAGGGFRSRAPRAACGGPVPASGPGTLRAGRRGGVLDAAQDAQELIARPRRQFAVRRHRRRPRPPRRDAFSRRVREPGGAIMRA